MLHKNAARFRTFQNGKIKMQRKYGVLQ